MNKIFEKYLDNQCSPEEVSLLLRYFNDHKNDSELKELILKSLENENAITTGDKDYWDAKMDEAFQNIKRKMNIEKAVVVPFYKKTWLKVAAAILLLVGAFAVYQITGKKANENTEVAKNNNTNDVTPGGNKAELILADGSHIILDNASNGNLAEQGSAKVVKLSDGKLAYNAEGNETQLIYNTISTPRGGQYQLTLADGSKVWLNAASSLRFPVSFTSNERKVEITGEAYFEVAKNPAKPFKVTVNDMVVEVLGTHFNINSYTDEATIKTTLLEGSVKISKGNAIQLLSPGQQVQVNTNGQIVLNKNIEIDEIVAWKNGDFIFSSADLQTIMRQISRWYDVDVSFEGNISKEVFSGIVSRTSKLSQVLDIMVRAGVKFKIEGKKILVM